MKILQTSPRSTHRWNFLMPAAAGAAFIGIIVVGVIPTFTEIQETELEIERLQADLQQQETLQPLFLSLQERRGRTPPNGVHLAAREPLEIDDLAALPYLFEALARTSGLSLVSATPQVRSLRDGREMLRIDTRMRGEFQTFNALMNRLNQMPFVEAIESLGINVVETGQEINLSVWLAIK
jgi:hypothetical protein